jgi:predicted 3-demethylubiquinone-9 3-methyltransferase (glyoxalase superfamily)
MTSITPTLWFDSQGLEAAEFYVALFPDSEITGVSHYGEGGPRPEGSVMTVQFTLDGHPYTALNGGPDYTLDEAFSLQIVCADQKEVDRYWEALTADGGEEGRCGWCKDRFGVSWQVVPDGLAALLSDPDPGRASRAVQAMLTMSKLDLDAMRAAADDES